MRSLKLLVRSRKDASALKHAISKIIGDPFIAVETLGGARGERLCRALEERLEPLTIAILGRGEAECGAIDAPPFSEVLIAGARKVRNLTLSQLASLVSRGRAGIRMRSSWTGRAIALSRGHGPLLEGQPVHPEGDSFILYGRGASLVATLLGLEHRPGDAFVLYKAGEGVHAVYGGPQPAGFLRFSRDRPEPEILEARGGRGSTFSLDTLVEENRRVVGVLEGFSKSLLAHAGFRRVIVPLSGGKDSAAALLLAVEALGSENVAAVYVDTGIDFPENRSYALRVAERLGVELVEARAGVDRGLLEGLPLPSPRNRWCTGRKLEALRRIVRGLAGRGYQAIVVGDRDAESGRRSLRPPLRFDDTMGGLPVVAPLKYWGGAHVEVLLLARGIGLNPLYELGFVRTGCYLCFALRPSWELMILRSIGYYERLARERPEQSKLINRFLSARLAGYWDETRGETKLNNKKY